MSAIILAGGKSSRMGVAKADMRLGGRSMLEHVVTALRHITEDIVLVAPVSPASTPFGLKVVTDEPSGGPLAALCRGLQSVHDEYSFVTGCDMPFLQPQLVRELFRIVKQYDAVVPTDADGLHPLCAVYSQRCLPAIQTALAAGERRMTSFYSQINAHFVEADSLRPFDPCLLSLFNVNTPEDFAKAEELLR